MSSCVLAVTKACEKSGRNQRVYINSVVSTQLSPQILVGERRKEVKASPGYRQVKDILPPHPCYRPFEQGGAALIASIYWEFTVVRHCVHHFLYIILFNLPHSFMRIYYSCPNFTAEETGSLEGSCN